MGGSVSGKHGDSFLFLRSTSSDLLLRFNPGQCTVFKIVKKQDFQWVQNCSHNYLVNSLRHIHSIASLLSSKFELFICMMMPSTKSLHHFFKNMFKRSKGIQGHHGQFLLGKAATVVTTSAVCRHCHRRFLFCKIQARSRSWGSCQPWRPWDM